jgi:diaminohydroxyphosphoribosylaminopyrimidine deaminase / 5-amino-6-(5-phosphoribosylamino)uracil reductase
MRPMTDEQLMQRALELAARGRFSTSPNPMVGCVIARSGEITGEGFHRRAGEPHAEIEALRNCTSDPRGATAYVTLEPCAHHGRTPPCADALIEAGVRRVVVAVRDPFDQVDGRGIARLEAAGIEVETGLMEEAARRQNERFFYNCAAKLPFLLLKAGMTLDGKLATVGRRSRWITGEASRLRSLELREEYDAILVGSGTVRDDDPQLSRRLQLSGSVIPWTRAILDAEGNLPPRRLLEDGATTLLYTTRPEHYRPSTGLELIAAEATDGAVDVRTILDDLFARGIRSVIAEGGSLLHSHLIAGRLWQKMILFVAPMIVGGAAAPSIFSGDGVVELTDAHRLRFDAVERLDGDLMITAYPPE